MEIQLGAFFYPLANYVGAEFKVNDNCKIVAIWQELDEDEPLVNLNDYTGAVYQANTAHRDPSCGLERFLYLNKYTGMVDTYSVP